MATRRLVVRELVMAVLLYTGEVAEWRGGFFGVVIYKEAQSLPAFAEEQAMKEVVSGVYTFTGLKVGRVYMIEDADGLTIIDAGLASAPAAIIKQIEAKGRKANDVKRILLTHAHPDHAGGLQELQALTGAQVMCSAGERAVAEGETPIPTPSPDKVEGLWRFIRLPETKVKGAQVGRELTDGETLPEVMGGLQVVFTPGHAPGHLAFWQPERRVLFCGDVMMHLRGLTLPFRSATVDMDEDRRAIRRLSALEPAVICFGHGNPLTDNASEKLKAFAAKEAK
jgi:glyoxylase-like metal-dependent hydrolase (beta-lactamase superfamily II)